MKALLLLCFIATIALMEGRPPMRGNRHRGMCKRLERVCEKGRRAITYCAWNKNTESFETVEKPVACMMHAIKCTKNKLEKPLHKGECRNCTESNVCLKQAVNSDYGGFGSMMPGDDDGDNDGGRWRRSRKGGNRRGRGICGTDGNKYENMCKFAVARCEAYQKDETILFSEPCRKQMMCKKLAGVCANETSKRNVTYCAWNADDSDYETVTNGAACFMHCLKCSKGDEKHPLHKGECGNCTKANVCRKPSMMEEHEDDKDDDDEDDDEDDGNVRVNVPSGRGKGGKWKGKGRGNKNRGRGGKKGGRKPKGNKGRRRRKVCDTEGNVYDSMCDFAVARCEKYAKDKEELKPAKCSRPKMY